MRLVPVTIGAWQQVTTQSIFLDSIKLDTVKFDTVKLRGSTDGLAGSARASRANAVNV